MKRLLPALAVASILSAAPAVADYRACMEFCTKERAFGHCNDVCSGQAANRPGPSPSTRPGSPAPPVTRTQPPAAAPKAAESLSISWLDGFWWRLRAEAGLDDVRLHDLRHSHASLALRNGETVLAIGRMLGHADPQTTLKYAHASDAMVTDAAEIVGAALKG